ncbi:hypothetical protein G4B88_015207 [Cannabis sativa]|uniref:DUF4283 domain-containing protein n=1 Tax=Cannabis sativa TaxID=3483 RepID=A0A7J6HBD3_CANSA|nr:hypothetical protein G4B88_015207 [Cannabis sativa]
MTPLQEVTEVGDPGIEAGEMDEMRQHFFDSMTLELEADVELSAEVTKKGILARTFGRRDIVRGRVKEILSKIWKLEGTWRMQTMKPWLWDIFFDNEVDKKEILKKRPWLVNGVLVNIREWPDDGSWEKVDMNKVRYWVEAHGLPTPYLTWENTDVIARKEFAYPSVGRAVPLYGAWNKVGVPIRNCFDPAIPRLKVDETFRRAEDCAPVEDRDKGSRWNDTLTKLGDFSGAKKACLDVQRKLASSGKLSQQRQRLSPSEEGIFEIARFLGYQFSSTLPVEGLGGGFTLLWNGNIDMEVVEANGGVFEVLIKEPITRLKWCMFAVNGRPYDNEKKCFWDILEARVNRGVGLGYRGCKFTWQNNRFSGGLTIERLDRVVVSGNWITAFPVAMVSNAPIIVSDHGYILLDSSAGK